jgi:chaperonin GroEL
MQKKKVLFGEDAKSKLESGIEIVSKAVKSTLGPRGNTVIIESPNHSAGLTITKDGVTVAKSVHLEDPTEDLAVRLIRESATRTASQAGDGTTTSIVLAEAILKHAKSFISKPNANTTEIARSIVKIGDDIIDSLTEKSTKVEGDDLMRIATISANNDTDLGEVISEAYKDAGKDGVVMIDRSPNHKTYFKTTEGVQFKRGLLTPHQITNARTQSCELKEPLILITSVELPSLNSIENLLKQIVQAARPLLIIGKLSPESIMALNHNVSKGLFKACHVHAPSFGDRSKELMSDMAIAFGAKHIDEGQGDNWEMVSYTDLGSAPKSETSMDSTSIARPDKTDLNSKVEKHIENLRSQLDKCEDDHEIESLKERIANLCGKVSTVYIGANSTIEQKEKMDRTEDAVLATKAAIESGTLPGGGLALKIESDILTPESDVHSVDIAEFILKKALLEPVSQIIRNSGKKEDEIADMLPKLIDGMGYDAKEDKIVNMIEAGIIDPAKVTKSSLKNAISVATTIMNTSAIITDVR